MKKLFITYCLTSLFLLGFTPKEKNEPSNSSKSEAIVFDVNSYEVYPNPAVDYLYVNFNESIAQDAEIEIRSFIGNKMQVQYSVESSRKVKFNISEMPAGHYYVLVTLDDKSALKKFVKRN